VGKKDRESNPGTEPFVPDFEEDTGTHAWSPSFDDDDDENDGDTGSQPAAEKADDAEEAKEEGEKEPQTEAPGTPVPPVAVPGRYHYLKWWHLVLVLLGVWLVAGVVGLGLFYWWYHSIDKTLVVFAVLVYLVACAVGGVMLAMVQGRPLLSALSIALMSGPLAAVAAAAPLYGYYYCARTGHCLIGVIPY
jgi:hypothetical protein